MKLTQPGSARVAVTWRARAAATASPFPASAWYTAITVTTASVAC